MKHNLPVTLILIGVFVLSQVVGLFLVGESLESVTCEDDNVTCTPAYEDTIVGERPETEGAGSLAYILIGVGIGTGLLLLIAKYGKVGIWRTWFFIAIVLATTIALGVVLHPLAAFIVALVLAAWKMWRPNLIVYNVAEVLMYSGIAVLLVPILNVFWMIILLALISVYDMIAVWKSKHMVTMAQFITGSNAFAGLVVPYDGKKGVSMRLPKQAQTSKKGVKKASKGGVKSAILGGGDITFPLLFSGVVLQERVASLVGQGVVFQQALAQGFGVSLLVSLGATAAVAWLFFAAKKDRFYPAMPFISVGCLAGWVLTFLF
ncbi:MAG: presenilin family intramembrane aspartyl protease [Candidatus Woesearchaeota archaeon]